ncbi:hypothetical protein PV327_008679 [Microctonus hyperodae]|uniref:Uncharacterized protein n=1 Tax=Microctonus hyperodae TaxID=165561 RepID=A0AA39F3L4_MICHY|nr:hypothetical protein PV327_008679 [Microctonus hyperodae]
MVYPTAQFVSANEGESLDIAVEFCAEPSYNKLLWLSSESVYVPGGEERDGVQALELESGGIETCFRTTLRIDAVQWSHSGEWMFIVRSQAGVADASVSVNVTRAFGFSRGSTLARSVMTIFYCLIVVFYSQQR